MQILSTLKLLLTFAVYIMEFKVSFNVNHNLYLKDPEQSELGKQIVKSAIDLIYELGFEAFTFKKLSLSINTTEASVYRYFENKHKILLYILNWYWSYMEFIVEYKLQNITDKKTKIKTVIDLLTNELPQSNNKLEYNKKYLSQIVICESSKAYFVKDIDKINKDELFKPYKDLCAHIASIITEYNSKYKYPKSLSSTIIEASHYQQFFSLHLPKLTDVQPKSKKEYTNTYLNDLVFKILG